MNELELSKKYLESDGQICPFCDSNDLQADYAQFDGSFAFQGVVCNNCNKSWTDTLTLTDVTFNT